MNQIHVHLHFPDGSSPDGAFERFARDLENITRRTETMSKKMDDLVAAVAEMETVEASTVTLLRGIAQRIEDGKADQNKMDELRSEILSKAAELGDAVKAVPADASAAPPAEPPAATPTDTGTPVG